MIWAKLKARKKLIDAFRAGGIYLGDKERPAFPKIHDVNITDTRTRIVFTLPIGINPEKVAGQEWLFKQVFGQHIDLDGKEKRFVLRVYPKGLPAKVPYKYEEWLPAIEGMALPVIVGIDLNGRHIAYDMDQAPHLLLSGETGSGKSSLLRAFLTTLMLSKQAPDVRFILCDMKRSEFGLFRNLPHVEGVYMDASDILPALLKIRLEMDRRGKLLDAAEVTHVRELPEKLPYYIVAVDEVALLQKEKEIMRILEDISSIGRSLGVILALSMQRPDYKLLDGKLKNNLTVRISGRQSNESNARIAGTPGADEIELDKKGRMIAVLDRTYVVQSPLLEFDEAKRLLQPLKLDDVVHFDKPSDVGLFDTVYDVVQSGKPYDVVRSANYATSRKISDVGEFRFGMLEEVPPQ